MRNVGNRYSERPHWNTNNNGLEFNLHSCYVVHTIKYTQKHVHTHLFNSLIQYQRKACYLCEHRTSTQCHGQQELHNYSLLTVVTNKRGMNTKTYTFTYAHQKHRSLMTKFQHITTWQLHTCISNVTIIEISQSSLYYMYSTFNTGVSLYHNTHIVTFWWIERGHIERLSYCSVILHSIHTYIMDMLKPQGPHSGRLVLKMLKPH